jgi:hypothetical protein
MNPKTICDTMALIAYELACAESFDRKAAKHRATAMRLQGEIHAEFSKALAVANERKLSACRVAVPE